MTIDSSLMNRCGLNHESVEHGWHWLLRHLDEVLSVEYGVGEESMGLQLLSSVPQTLSGASVTSTLRQPGATADTKHCVLVRV